MKRAVWNAGRQLQLTGDELSTMRRALAVAIMEDARTMKREPPKTDPHRRATLAITVADEQELFGKLNTILDDLMTEAEMPK